MRPTLLAPLCLLLACGDDSGGKKPDAGTHDAAIEDAPDASTVVPCSYTEMSDATNDDLFGTGTPENTSISFTGTTTAICGKFNMGHYNGTELNLDVDTFQFTVPAMTRGQLFLTASGAENFDLALIEISGTVVNIDETGEFRAGYATTSVALPPDDYTITISAFDGADATSVLDYKLTLVLDDANRCAKSTAMPAGMEMNEGAPVGGGNDVIEVNYMAATRSLTTLPNDSPENTNVTVLPDMSYRLTGVNSTFTATPMSWQDSFQDRDTYAVTMGPTANMLSVRLNWPGTADFDLFVFEMDDLGEIAKGWYANDMEDEFTTLAVTPGAMYRIWAGLSDTSTGQPINYDLTLCGGIFTP